VLGVVGPLVCTARSASTSIIYILKQHPQQQQQQQQQQQNNNNNVIKKEKQIAIKRKVSMKSQFLRNIQLLKIQIQLDSCMV